MRRSTPGHGSWTAVSDTLQANSIVDALKDPQHIQLRSEGTSPPSVYSLVPRTCPCQETAGVYARNAYSLLRDSSTSEHIPALPTKHVGSAGNQTEHNEPPRLADCTDYDGYVHASAHPKSPKVDLESAVLGHFAVPFPGNLYRGYPDDHQPRYDLILSREKVRLPLSIALNREETRGFHHI